MILFLFSIEIFDFFLIEANFSHGSDRPPYKSLTDAMLRDLELKVEEAMRSAGMVVVGKHGAGTTL